jgi:hypothetical protein
LVQAFRKKWWVESDFKAPNLPLLLRLNDGNFVITLISSLGSLMFLPNEIILLFFFRLADVFSQRDLFAVLL